MKSERIISPAPRYNRGVGLPSAYLIDPNWLSPDCRNCRFCGKYDDGLLKIGLRAYAHVHCFEAKYGPLSEMPRHSNGAK